MTIIDCEGTSLDNHRGFYFHSGEDSSSVLQGFTIKNGYTISGGGMKNWYSNQTVTNCILWGNLPDEIFGVDNFVTLADSIQVIKSYTAVVPSGHTKYGIYSLDLYINGEYEDGFQCEINRRDNIEIRWDDGGLGSFWAWYNSCNIWAIRGCFPDGALLDSIGVRLLSENDPYWPWPDAIHQPIELMVFDDDGPDGLPGTMIYTSGETYVNPGTGQAVAYPGIPINGSFYIGNHQLTDFPYCEGQLMDDFCDYPDEMFHRIGGVWSNAGCKYEGDFMIWGIGHMSDIMIHKDNPSQF